jgi:RNA polymerase sigma factor (TIGR02999 family)
MHRLASRKSGSAIFRVALVLTLMDALCAFWCALRPVRSTNNHRCRCEWIVLGFNVGISYAAIAAPSLGHLAAACDASMRRPEKNNIPLTDEEPDPAPNPLWRPASTPAERRSLNQLFSATYEELRRLAAAVRRGDPSATLNPTALVNEAWLKMAKSAPAVVDSPLHFKRIAARAMRQLLVEAARRRQAGKRADRRLGVTFDPDLHDQACAAGELLAIEAALERLESLNPRQAAMIEGRFFGGLEVGEIALLLNVSEATVLRDWRAARAWLARELRSSP